MKLDAFIARITNCAVVTLHQYDDDLEEYELCDEVVDRMIPFMTNEMSVEDLRDMVEDIVNDVL